MFQENNIHTKIAINVLRSSSSSNILPTLINIERFYDYGNGNRFMRRLHKLIEENKIDKYKLVKNHFMKDFIYLTTSGLLNNTPLLHRICRKNFLK